MNVMKITQRICSGELIKLHYGKPHLYAPTRRIHRSNFRRTGTLPMLAASIMETPIAFS